MKSLLQVVAENVRRHRAARRWSQQELADRSRVSRGMIVRIEGGEDNVSLATLGRIALAFGVSFTDVVMAPAGGAGLPEHRVQVWRGTRPGTRIALLGSFVGPRMTDLFECTLAPGDRYQGEPDQENTRQMAYVVKGTLVLEHGSGTRTLGRGDSVVFPSDQPYAFANPGKTPLRFILSVAG